MGHRIAYRSILRQRLIALENSDGKAPIRVQIMRDGNLGWLGFENLELDAKSAQNIIDHFNEAGVDLPIDYHHATMKEEEGKVAEAPAAGWIKADSLEYIEGDGLYGAVEWTDKATKQIEAGEYKYLSPVVLTDETTDEIELLHSMALTNRPRTKDQIELLKAAELLAATGKGDLTVPTTKKLKAVTAQDVPEELAPLPAVDETQKLLSDLIAVMQQAGITVADDAPLSEVLIAAIEAVQGAAPVEKPEEEVEEVAAETTTPVADAVTPVPATPLPCKAAETPEMCAMRVKAEAFGPLNERVKRLEAEAGKKRVDELIEAEITAGKILPDDTKMIAAARGLANADEKQFKLVYGAMTPICEPGRIVTPAAVEAKTEQPPRAKLIAASAEQFDKDGEAKYGAKKRYYVAAALDEADESELTEAEIAELEKVGA